MYRCPVCEAQQELSESCRRCDADLTLAAALYRAIEARRAECLAALHERRYLRATRAAAECWKLSSSEANARRLATCYMLQGDFAAALQLLPSSKPQRLTT